MKAILVTLSLIVAGLALADVPNGPPPTPAPAPSHPQGIEKAAGVISGGWEYVYGAYGLAVLGIAGYALSLVVRRPKSQERAP